MKHLSIILMLLIHTLVYGQTHLPGGVSNPDIWYKTTWKGLAAEDFVDFSKDRPNRKRITPCSSFGKGLFNFNPSLNKEFCLKYRGMLEGLKKQNLFFVSEPVDTEKSFRHVESDFFYPDPMSPLLNYEYLDSLSRNSLALDTKQGYASRQATNFNQYQKANVHFYDWHNYDQNKIFKSYGFHGESEYKVGVAFNLEELEDSHSFRGLLPEFVVYNRELNDNERNRVESYLALKYGITLNSKRSYKNAENKIFWNQKNNKLFANNIFGMGRDDISGLNQLQSESVHKRDYLIMGVDGIKDTNEELQHITNIENNEFFVSGNTKASGIAPPNEQGLRFLNKVWLAQITGQKITDKTIFTKFDIKQEFNEFLDEILHEKLFVYMVQDPFVNHTYVSDFDNGNIIYTKADALEPVNDQIYAHFKKVFFDHDLNNFDQYTFAVGPEIIIQIRYVEKQCKGKCFEVEIVIQGGDPLYEVLINDGNGNSMPAIFDREEDKKFIYIPQKKVLCAPYKYSVHVKDRNGSQANYYPFEVKEKNNTLDLGSDQILTNQQPEIPLDAGAGLDDPDTATYEWSFNGAEISFNEREFLVNQTGRYCVKVTTGDLSCVLSDCVRVLSGFKAKLKPFVFCDEDENYIEIYLNEGIMPIQGNIQGVTNSSFTLNFLPDSNPYILFNIPYGVYNLTLTDAVGAVYEETIDVSYSPTPGGPITIVNDLDPILYYPQTEIQLDASHVLIPTPNATTYQWFHNDEPLAFDTEIISITQPGIYKVEVYDDQNCPVKASIEIIHKTKGSLNVEGEGCKTLLSAEIEYGFPPFHLETIPDIGITPHEFGGNFEIYPDFPTGEYTVILKDNFGETIFNEEISVENIELNIYEQIENNLICSETFGEEYFEEEIPELILESDCVSDTPLTLDASQLMSGNTDITYKWYLNGTLITELPEFNFIIIDPTISVCDFEEQYFGDEEFGFLYEVIATNTITGCEKSQTFFIPYRKTPFLCPIINQPESFNTDIPITLSTKLYPNPGQQDVTFYYEVYWEESFSGTVQIYNMTGALIKQQHVLGETHYTLPFNLLASGTYFIKITTDEGSVKIDRIIIK